MKKLILFLLMIICVGAFCQPGGVAISPNGSPPAASAGLDVNFMNKGFLMPRLTKGQRDSIAAPDLGLMIFNTTTNCVNMWLGTSWKQICGDCDFNNPVPGNNGPICGGQTLNLTATSILGATYQWTGPNGFSSNQQNSSISNATASASGSYSVQATLNGCTSQPQSTVATVNAVPQTPTAGNSGPGCVGQNIDITASTTSGATYSWTGPNGYSATAQNPVLTNVQTNQNGTYNVVANVAGCNSEAAPTVVIIRATPSTPGNISGIDTACANATGNVYTIDTVSGATTYTWTVPAGANITGGQGTPSITVTFGAASGNISVTAGNACGTSAARTFPVYIISSSQTFVYTGAMQTFTVPSNCSSINSITITAYGAQGSWGSTAPAYPDSAQIGPGGKGGMATGTLSVTPGQVLYVFVGGIAGFNGGGAGGPGLNEPQIGPGGAGGGASDVRVGGTDLASRVIIAGGGGGGGGQEGGGGNGEAGTAGGAGGGEPGSSGSPTNYIYGYAYGGVGGSQSGGGAGGCYTGGGQCGFVGSLGQGGNGGTGNGAEGGGGGGGYYGGGGGGSWGGGSGGGGGDGYLGGSISNGTMQSGVQWGNGQVVITW